MNKKGIAIGLIVIASLLIGSGYFLGNSNKTNEKKPVKPDDSNFSYTPIMYKVCDNDSCVTLFASFILGTEKITKYNKIVDETFNKSDGLSIASIYTDDMGLISQQHNRKQSTNKIISKSLYSKISSFINSKNSNSVDELLKMPVSEVYGTICYYELFKDKSFSELDAYHFIDKKENTNMDIIFNVKDYYTEAYKYDDNDMLEAIDHLIDNYDKFGSELLKSYDYYLKSDINNLKKSYNIMTQCQSEKYNAYINNFYNYQKDLIIKSIDKYLAQNKNYFVIASYELVISNDGLVDRLKTNYKVDLIK